LAPYYRSEVDRDGHNWLLARVSTTNFVGALDDAAEYAITRFVEMNAVVLKGSNIELRNLSWDYAAW
jgi:hypothetical protein